MISKFGKKDITPCTYNIHWVQTRMLQFILVVAKEINQCYKWIERNQSLLTRCANYSIAYGTESTCLDNLINHVLQSIGPTIYYMLWLRVGYVTLDNWHKIRLIFLSTGNNWLGIISSNIFITKLWGHHCKWWSLCYYHSCICKTCLQW